MTEFVIYSNEKFKRFLQLNSERSEFVGKERVAKTLNAAISFDIETSSFKQNDKKYATMYVWAFDIYDVTFVGRTWKEFQDLIYLLHKQYKTNSKKLVRIYVHNLSYEFQFMHKWFKWNKIFAIKARTVLYAVTDSFIEFRCSYFLYGSKLSTLAEDMNMDSERSELSKIQGYDYKLLRTYKTPLTPFEIEYVITDVKIVTKYINQCIRSEKGGISTIPLTKTGYVRRLCRDRCLSYKSYVNMIHGMNLTYNEYITAKGAFAGGYVHSSPYHTNKVMHDITSFDFASSYPAVMLSEKYPMSTGIEVTDCTREEFDELMHNHLCIVTLHLRHVKAIFHNDYYISLSKCEKVSPYCKLNQNWSLVYDGLPLTVSNGRIKEAEEIVITTTSIDYRTIESLYDFKLVGFQNLYYYHEAYLPKTIIETILDLYADKTLLKGVKGKEEQYLMSKGMLNSMYGMSVTDILRNEYQYDSERSEWEKPLIVSHMDQKIKEEKIEIENNKHNRFLFYLWGCFVTAYARRNLWTGIYMCGDDYIYSDTDSIKIRNAEKHLDFINDYNTMIVEKIDTCLKYFEIDPERSRPKGKQMGIWDFDGHYTFFKTLGAKRYVYLGDDHEIHITIAGLGKKAGGEWLTEQLIEQVRTFGKSFDEALDDIFNDDMLVPAGRTGKMTHSYIDEECNITVVDYKGIEAQIHELSSIHLEECEYHLGCGEFLEFLHFWMMSMR